MASRERRDVVVTGAGSAGLACAWRLARAGLDVRVLEAADAPGGNVRTEERQGFLLERGPHTIMASADGVFDLAHEVGLDDALRPTRPEAGDRFVARNGRLHAIPSGPWSFLTTDLLSAKAKLTLMTEPLRLQRGEPTDTAAMFFARRFGPEAARVLAGAFISGVYAGDPEALSAPAAFPLFWGFEQETGSMIRGAMRHFKRRKAQRLAEGRPARSGLWSLEGGLGTLTRTTALRLGDRVLCATPVRAVSRVDTGFEVRTDDRVIEARSVVVAAPPEGAASVLAGLDAPLSTELGGIALAPVAMVQLGFRTRLPEIPEGFGFLVPRGEGIRTLGVLFPSRLFEGRTPPGGDLLAGFVGGTLDPDALALPDDALVEAVRGDLRTLTGLQAPPDLVEVRRYRGAIPQFTQGHLERMDRVRSHLARHPGLFLAGNYLGGVGMKDAVRAGFEAASACATFLGSGT